MRTKTQANGAHRNIFRENLIENNGTPKDQIPERYRNLPAEEVKGCGFNIAGVTEDVILDRNIIRDTRSTENASQLHAVYLHQGVSNLKMINNEISGHPAEKIVDHSGDPSNDLQDVPDI